MHMCAWDLRNVNSFSHDWGMLLVLPTSGRVLLLFMTFIIHYRLYIYIGGNLFCIEIYEIAFLISYLKHVIILDYLQGD